VAQFLASGIAIIDNQGRLAFVNKALEQFLGCGHGELFGQQWELLLPEETGHRSWPAARCEAQLRCQDGTA
jgi:PAS domain S-box-containing protein